MSVEFWMGLWKIVLIGGFGLFATLAIVVTIGGAIDVGRLLKSLREEHARASGVGSDNEGAGAEDRH
jgi:hypothetical protein